MNRIKEERLTREFVENPDLWPLWPILPLKRRREPLMDPKNCGCLIDDGTLVVYLTNAFDQDFDHCEKISYPDFNALARDGWVVD